MDGGFPAHGQIDAIADKTDVHAPVLQTRPKKDAQGQMHGAIYSRPRNHSQALAEPSQRQAACAICSARKSRKQVMREDTWVLR